MRNLPVVLLLLAAFAIGSCSDEDPVPELPFFNASVDGASKQCDKASASTAGGLQINARNEASGIVFALFIADYTPGEIGTFNIGAGNFNTALYQEGGTSYSAGTTAGSGRIVITNANSSSIQGTFQFTGFNLGGASKNITDGAFRIFY
jgi:hypothetical protein